MAVDTNYRRIGRNEIIVSTICQKSFRRQSKFLKENLKELYENYPNKIEAEYNYLNQPFPDIYAGEKAWQTDISSEPMDGFWREMGVYDMIDSTKPQIKKTVDKAYTRRYRNRSDSMEKYGYTFDKNVGIQYMDTYWELNLSNFKWSISRTTKVWVINVLKDGLDNNLGVKEVAKNITALDNKLFAPSRAKTIAITEVGKAYEHGNFVPAKQLQNAGVGMVKLWATVRDSRVRPSHRDNESLSRKPLDFVYPATNTPKAPTGVGCRCTMLYEINEQGKVYNDQDFDKYFPQTREAPYLRTQVDKFVNKHPWMTFNEWRALMEYTDTSGPILNKMIRGQKEWTTKYRVLDQFVWSWFGKTGVKDYKTVYRGLSFKSATEFNAFIDSTDVNNILTDNAYTSTTLDKAVTKDFFKPNWYDVTMKITNPQGIPLSDISLGPWEKEILLAKWTQLKIVDINRWENSAEIVLEYVNIKQISEADMLFRQWLSDADSNFRRRKL